MSDQSRIVVDAARLVPARELAHDACQWLARAARANLAPRDDDSHSNLGWDSRLSALVSHDLTPGLSIALGFSFTNAAFIWMRDGAAEDELTLSDTDAARAWVDKKLIAAGLKDLSHAEMPYALDVTVNYRDFDAQKDELRTLGAWFGVADNALTGLIAGLPDYSPGPSPVRCWPHHFDIATLIGLEEGDPETARSIGVGMSPGDESMAQPYFYCSPWPVADGARLPAAPTGFSWHTEGFTSLVAPASGLNDGAQIAALLPEAFRTAESMLRTRR